jgi:hypothetical protein
MNPCCFYTISSFRDIPRMKCVKIFAVSVDHVIKVAENGREEKKKGAIVRYMRRLVNESNLRIHRTPTHQYAQRCK